MFALIYHVIVENTNQDISSIIYSLFSDIYLMKIANWIDKYDYNGDPLIPIKVVTTSNDPYMQVIVRDHCKKCSSCKVEGTDRKTLYVSNCWCSMCPDCWQNYFGIMFDFKAMVPCSKIISFKQSSKF